MQVEPEVLLMPWAPARAEDLVQHVAPQRAVASTGKGTASSALGYVTLRAGSCPYPSYGPYVQESYLPFGPKPLQKMFMCLKAFEDRGAAIFNIKCHAQWWKVSWKVYSQLFLFNWKINTYLDYLSAAAALRKEICPAAEGSQVLLTALRSALSNIQTEFNTCDPLPSVVMR